MKKHRKLKMTICIIFSVIAVLVLAVIIFVNQPSFGKQPSGERLVRMERSPYYINGIMENETPITMAPPKKGGWKAAWKFASGTERCKRLIPNEGEIPVVKTDLRHLPSYNLMVWFGHSSFLLQINGKVILVDPVLVMGSPVSFVNKSFKGCDYYKPEMMPETIDYLLISHDHWDHLDYGTVTELMPRIGKVVCPLGVGEDFEYWGFTKENIIELDANETSGWFHCLPTRHFSGRGLADRMKTQRASWLIDTGSFKVFYTGDGGYSNRFERFGRQFPDIDLAIMENGQYDKRWSLIHTMPDQLGKEVKALSPKRFITVHHSKFALANHAWDEPRKNEQVAASESGVPLIVAKIGEVIKLRD